MYEGRSNETRPHENVKTAAVPTSAQGIQCCRYPWAGLQGDERLNAHLNYFLRYLNLRREKFPDRYDQNNLHILMITNEI